MEPDHKAILTSPGFVMSVSLLLVNDFYLKSALNNSFTGKLSDFAGLFAFTLFWLAIFPRHRRSICLTIALIFAYWKSSYSQPVLDLWNGFGLIRFSRTVDLTDLVALMVLPAAHLYPRLKLSAPVAPHWARAALVLIAVFAFTATSFRTEFDDYNNKYYYAGSKAELFKKIDDLRLTYFDEPLPEFQKDSGKLAFQLPSSICFNRISVELQVVEGDKQTEVSILKLRHDCPKEDGDRERLLAEFEKEFIERLRTGTPQTKHSKSKVEASFSPGLPVQ